MTNHFLDFIVPSLFAASAIFFVIIKDLEIPGIFLAIASAILFALYLWNLGAASLTVTYVGGIVAIAIVFLLILKLSTGRRVKT